MRKKVLSLVLAAAMVFGMTGCDSAISSESKSDSGDKSDTIKVGVLLSTTGDFSISETPMKNCAQMAIDEINEKGGINGKKIKAIYSDYGSDPSMAAEKAQELILNDKVCAIVGTNSTSTRLSVEPIIEKYDNLLVYNTFYEGEKPSDNVLYTNTVPSQQVDGFLPYITKNIGKKIFFVGSDYEFPKNTISYAKKKLKDLGAECVGEEYAPSGTTDFASIVNKIKSAKPDVIFSAVAGNDSVSFYSDCSQYGIDMKKTQICSVACHEGTVKGIGKAAVGTYSCFNYFNVLGTTESDEFVKKYKEKYGTDTTVNNGAESTYTGVYMLADAIEKAGSTKPADIVKAAAGMEISCPAGKIKMDEKNHHAWLPIYIGKVNKDLTFDIVSKSDGLVEPVTD